ncbi:C40 family peptidase [Oerskovia flava]|uniref:C40 family peptidase n=1 Tax=Oerskovia flava TaxID=2986422 RepID=UPI00223F9A10|nr:NlpC/P60 family protein [Oerskovia sp. JB1-3-2]
MTATTWKQPSTLSVKYSRTTQTVGQAPASLRAAVKVGGKAATGKILFKIDNKVVRTVALKNGVATARFPNLSAGKRKVSVVYRSGSSSVAGSWKASWLTVKSAGSPVVKEALKHVGTPYRYGGTTPSGFDCSGFTSYVYKKAGVKTLPRTSSAQGSVGTKVSKSKAKPGDLIWTPGHVSIYLGGNKQVDAPRPGKTIQVRQIWQSNPRFIRVNNKAIGA